MSIVKKDKKTGISKNLKIGYSNTYRAQFSNIDIRCNPDEVAKYPFDKSYLQIKFEIVNLQLPKGDITVIFNVHNASILEVNRMFLEPFEMRVRFEMDKNYISLQDRPDSELSDELLIKK